MRFHVGSDYHQNVWPVGRGNRISDDIEDRVNLPPRESYDYRLLAGDLTNGIRPCKLDPDKQIPTIRVLGNHCLWGEYPTFRHAYFRAQNHEVGTHWVTLNNSEIQLEEDVVILGATLFTQLPEPGEELKAILETMNDFKYSRGLNASAWNEEFHRSAQFLKEMTKKHKAAGKKVVLLVHYLPVDSASVHQDDPDVSRAYYTDLLKTFEVKPDLVIHGHDHRFRDEILEGVRVVCNPLGYYNHKTGQFEETGFKPDFIIEI